MTGASASDEIVAVVIPLSAVVQEDNQSVVYVVENGSAVRRALETGIESDGWIEILGGLDGHEKIVITGQGGLRDGSRVIASNSAESPVIG